MSCEAQGDGQPWGPRWGEGVHQQGRGAEGGSREISEEATVMVQAGGDGGLGWLQNEPRVLIPGVLSRPVSLVQWTGV